ncbi:MAG: hypothetical protein QXY18_01110 [Nitrososphaerota archaeon]
MNQYGGKSKDEILIKDSLKIIEEGEKNNVILRLLGAIAIKIHSQEYEGLYIKLNRLGKEEIFTDIDLLAYSKEAAKVRKLMENILGYKIPGYFLLMHGRNRLLYYHPEGLYHIDIFFDKLQFSHDIYFGSDPNKGRLKLDYPTIPLSDLLLEKLQIHEINEKDIKDIIVLLRSHEIGQTDEKEIINAKYVAKVLANDWGFWYDAKINFEKIKKFANDYYMNNLLTKEDLENINGKINKIIEFIDIEPKTKEWNKRAKIGTNKQWWRNVEDIMR